MRVDIFLRNCPQRPHARVNAATLGRQDRGRLNLTEVRENGQVVTALLDTDCELDLIVHASLVHD